MTKTKVSPNRILRDQLRAKDHDVELLWEMRGPKDTAVAWLSCYEVSKPDGSNKVLVIVETYENGRGWEAFVVPVAAAPSTSAQSEWRTSNVREFFA